MREARPCALPPIASLLESSPTRRPSRARGRPGPLNGRTCAAVLIRVALDRLVRFLLAALGVFAAFASS